MNTIGDLGEKVVAKWLESQNWIVLNRQWRSIWGEIDLISRHRSSDTLAFVEVKTRQKRNWDENGLLAITQQKQAKICRTAAQFISEYPNFADFTCRFDVAIVSYRKNRDSPSEKLRERLILPQTNLIFIESGYQFTIETYFESAFEN